MVSRGLGWRIHGSVEDTKLSTNKQHSLSLCPTPRSWRCWTASAAASSSSCAACFLFCALAAFTLQVPTPLGYLCPLICVVAFTSEVRLRRAVVPAHALLLCRLRWPLLSLHPTWPASCPPPMRPPFFARLARLARVLSEGVALVFTFMKAILTTRRPEDARPWYPASA